MVPTKTSDVATARDEYKEKLEKCQEQVQRFLKYFNVIQEQVRDANTEYLGY